MMRSQESWPLVTLSGLTPELPIWSVQEGRGSRCRTELQSEKPGCGGGVGWCQGPSHLAAASLPGRWGGSRGGARGKLAGRWWSGGGRGEQGWERVGLGESG